ncbi:glycosyl transferase family 4 [Fulvimonas sp. R45]|uniref:glycosyl transferase family 4 n=1 Tax=Fulvimonas sp. R45 TaxID=3045937 RepID=UPI00265F476C|nr:glycosyl transferase family 4 [Fulvimonas sp. R45]MDO1527301.1 glycosyl transferase family 4 [Fulvimonas sp. R45]
MTLLAPGLVLVSLLLSAGVVRAAIGYAHRRGMLDRPGQRRSHAVPTPRGGGIGVVVAVLVTLPVCLRLLAPAWPVTLVVALALAFAVVALVGWWDDHRPLPVLPRFSAQLAAAALFTAALLATGGLSWWWAPLLVLGGTWSVNLHNFMDGIDGLLAQQTVFVAAGLAVMAWLAGQPALCTACACLAAAALGFWRYNRSPARIFMGDVGSGSLGLLLFMLIAMLWRVEHRLLWPALALCSAFVTDAGLTLLSRMLRGRRWYTAHREHLYQWMVRSGCSHTGGTARYLGWNVLVALPLASASLFVSGMALPFCMVAYLAAAATWLALKRRLSRRRQ